MKTEERDSVFCPIFRAGKTPKIPFLGLSLLPNTTATLGTQATIGATEIKATFTCCNQIKP